MSSNHIRRRLVLLTRGSSITRRLSHLSSRIGRAAGMVGGNNTYNHGLSFVVRRFGHRTGALTSGSVDASMATSNIRLGILVRRVQRRVRGVRWCLLRYSLSVVGVRDLYFRKLFFICTLVLHSQLRGCRWWGPREWRRRIFVVCRVLVVGGCWVAFAGAMLCNAIISYLT